MAIIIFDLDGTVIDTSHRYRNKPCGTIDLDYWFANSTEEQIARDTLLPLANTWRNYHREGHTIIVCTARDFSPNPRVPVANPGQVYRNYLAANNLPYHALLHRTMAGPEHLSMGDGELKTVLLNDYAIANGFTSIADMGAIMFDDNLTVIRALIREGVQMIDATRANKKIERMKKSA